MNLDATVVAPPRPDGPTALAGPASAVPPAYRGERVTHLPAFLARCEALAGPHTLPFHATGWLRAWYATLGAEAGRRPVLVAVQANGRDVALLALVGQRRAGLRVVEFADAGVSDYAAPILAPDWRGDAEPGRAAAALWRAIRAALSGHDVFLIDKLLDHLLDVPAGGEAVNPLRLALPVCDSELFGNQFSAPDGWEAWRRSLDKTVRKEIERCWRVFHRHAGACFESITDRTEAQRLFDILEAQQSERMHALGKPYVLDQPAYRAFYRQLLDDGLARGEAVLTVLRVDDEVVSALFGVANGRRYIALRQSVGAPQWRTVSPGRLLDEQTAHHFHDRGHTHFDFGIGDYHHKAALKLQPIALHQACVALSWRGWPRVGWWHLRRWLKHQALVRRARQWLVRGRTTAAAPAGVTPRD